MGTLEASASLFKGYSPVLTSLYYIELMEEQDLSEIQRHSQIGISAWLFFDRSRKMTAEATAA